VISIFAERIARGEAIDIHGDGRQIRDFVYVAYVVRVLVRAMERAARAPQVLNVCTGRPTTIGELAAILCRIAGREVARRPQPARAASALGIEAETAVEDGLTRTLASLVAR